MAGLAVHAMALTAVWLSALSPAGLIAGSGAVLLSLSFFVVGQRRPVFTRLQPGDGVVTLSGSGGDLPVSPPIVCFMAAGALLLRFRYRRAGQRQRAVHLLLLPDSLSTQHSRYLYRYLGGWADEELLR
jgi:hypothetical protein